MFIYNYFSSVCRVEGEEPGLWREPGVHRRAARRHLPGRGGVPRHLGHHGGPAPTAAAEILSKWWRNFIPLKFLWHLWFCFSFFLLHPPPLKKSTRAFADSAEDAPSGVRPPAEAACLGPHGPFLLALVREVSRWGGEGQLLQAIILLFLFLILTIVHISRKVSLKTKTNPEMYI